MLDSHNDTASKHRCRLAHLFGTIGDLPPPHYPIHISSNTRKFEKANRSKSQGPIHRLKDLDLLVQDRLHRQDGM